MKDYADSKYVEEALYYDENNYEYAMKVLRLKTRTLSNGNRCENKLKAKYPTSPYLAEAENIE